MMAGRFSGEKAAAFDAELGKLVQKYLDMPDADPLALAMPLNRRGREVAFIAADERQKFHEDLRKNKGKTTP
jgi:hypothetical protein